jgi:DNA-binding SARP family transcriptional activator
MAWFGVLGTVAFGNGRDVSPVPWPMARSVLAALLLKANRVVSSERLVEVLWEDAPPVNALPSLQNHVMRLRRLIADAGGSQIKTVAPGYLIEVTDGSLDLTRFRTLYAAGRRALDAGDPKAARTKLSAALALWRGEPLEDVTSSLLREQEKPGLQQMRLNALEARIDADLQLRRYEEIVAELVGLTAAHPLQERFHAQLMLAYAHAGRQAEALATFQKAREVLAEELGTNPGPALQELHQKVLIGQVSMLPAPRVRLAARPAQLPASLEDFTGRAEEAAQLVQRLGARGQHPGVVPVVVLTGQGGSGKTSLAVHVSHQLRDEFPDGQLFARLGGSGFTPVPAGEVLAGFLHALGADATRIPPGEPERAAMYRSMIAGQRVLVVLDDARDSRHVAQLLPGTAGCAAIVTSRKLLADLPGARQLRLPGFTDDEAVELLAKIVGADRMEGDKRACRRLAELCGGLPLALRIAGTRLVCRPQWRVSDLTDRLADPARRLDELTVGDLSVRAAFAASYAGLRDDAHSDSMMARAFLLLASWAGGGITASAVAAILDTDIATAKVALEALFDRHLIEAGAQGRYRMPSLLGLYAAERAREKEIIAERITDPCGINSVYIPVRVICAASS